MKIERLRGLDAAFLYLETPTQQMHVTGVMILEPEKKAGDGSRATDPRRIARSVTELLRRRLVAQRAFRRRVVAAPLGIAHPAWVEVPRPDKHNHVHSLTLPKPGSVDQLTAAVSRIAATPLDRRHPLWELWTIAGVENGRFSVVLKVHHAILDGVSGVEVLGRLFTTEPENTKPGRRRTPIRRQDEPTPAELAVAALRSMLRAPASFAQTLTNTARAVPPVLRGLVEGTAAATSPILPFSAPRTRLNRALTAARAVAFGSVPLASVKEIKNAFGVTVNDIVLAACARALGDYLRAHGESPRQPMVASVPVSEHVVGDASQPSNRVSAMFVGLPVQLTDVADIVEAIHAQSLGAKSIHASLGPAMLANWVKLAPPPLFAGAVDLYSRWQLADWLPPPHSIVISNVAGPPFPLFAGGARLVAAYPLGPVLEGAGINISVLSYAGSVDIGLITCPRAVPEPAEIARGFERAIEDFLDAARRRSSSGRSVGS